jgi:catechol 2,3-dioxygenase-like lactoylglutathione lyase family enzyme
MLDHVIVGVDDYERSKAFYEAALAPLGYELVMEIGDSACGLGPNGKPDFWIARDYGGQVHVAFTAPDRVRARRAGMCISP